MWVAFALVVLTCGGNAFMIPFLIALLRERSPSVCYWVIPAVATEVEEREQEVFETSLEFDISNLARSPVSAVCWRVVNPWEATARTAHWNRGGKKA
jgi:hypothetical protein